MFARHKVDFVLQGHDHTYVRGQVPVIERNHTTGKKKIIQRIPATDERTYENTVRYSKENL